MSFVAMEEYAREQCERFKDPSHDFAHVMRVTSTARSIGKAMGADLSVLIPAALLHDIVHVPKNHPDRKIASARAAEEARKLLTERFGIDSATAARIATVILEHSFSAGHAPSSLESRILQDSDRLDAIGAIGIARVFSCGTKMGSSFYNREDPWAKTRELDDRNFVVDHFFVKLFKLEQGFHTPMAREEASRRTRHMRSFLEQLLTEIQVGRD